MPAPTSIESRSTIAKGPAIGRLCAWWFLAALVLAGSGCRPPNESYFQGYLEGEYIYVASPVSGLLESLWVNRGDVITNGQPLFSLESEPEASALKAAEAGVAEAAAQLSDRQKGLRPSELEALQAEQARIETELDLARQLLRRREAVRTANPGAVSEEVMDESRSLVASLEAQKARSRAAIETGHLGSREDEVRMAAQALENRKAESARAQWALDQKRPRAAAGAVVHDTLFRRGEFVPATRPVVVLLPPQNVKVRFFVPETALAQLRLGDEVQVTWDGAGRSYPAVLRYVSTRAEYTPPVIYSRETRAKLVYLVEAFFAPEHAAELKVGQPVEVTLGSTR